MGNSEMSGLIISKIITILILPPGGPIIIMLLGLILLRRFRKIGVILIVFALLVFTSSSLPVVSKAIRPDFNESTAARSAEMAAAEAIVVLGAGLYVNAPEYGEDTLSGSALERVRYGAYLHRRTGKPLLVTGGRPKNTKLSEAEAMRRTLEQEFGVPVQWSEERSLNTRDNANYSFLTLQAEEINKIILVTHASHMPRAVAEFERVGFDVTPAPTKIRAAPSFSYFDLLPSAAAMNSTARNLHEWLGRAWYHISG